MAEETPCAEDWSRRTLIYTIFLNKRMKFLFSSYTFNVKSLPCVPSNEADLHYRSDVMKHVSSAISVIPFMCIQPCT